MKTLGKKKNVIFVHIKKHYYSPQNNKVTGTNKIAAYFMGLQSGMYSYLVDDDDKKSFKNAKGIKISATSNCIIYN